MNIVFVAGGLGTRFKELSVFPKLLLPTANYNSILSESISKFDANNDFYIIINSKYYDMLDNYISINHLKDSLNLKSLTIIKTSVANGSLSTLTDVENLLPKEDVLFVWSDVILPNKDEFDIQKECEKYNFVYQCHLGYYGVLFTSSENQYRYNFDGEYIQKSAQYKGNIPGIYYFTIRPTFSNVSDDIKALQNADLVDLLRSFMLSGHYIMAQSNIPNIVEYKDLETYKDLLKKHSTNFCQTRFFNKISIDKEKGIVKKEAINKDYFNIINDEAQWYKNVISIFNKNEELSIPKIYNIESNPAKIEMEYLEGYIPLHVYINNASKTEVINVYNSIHNALCIFESNTKTVKIADFEQDIKKELYTKVIDRCDKISYMLINYDKRYLSDILNKVVNTVLSLYKNCDNIQYNICHGDLNGSNVMVDINNPNNIKFIDPRGYFGFTKLYGWNVYEYAKLLYGLYGYDNFNLKSQLYLTDEPHINKYVNDIEYLKKPIYKLIVGVIYVALAGYISQDIMKANIAYEYGLKIINDYYNNEKEA